MQFEKLIAQFFCWVATRPIGAPVALTIIAMSCGVIMVPYYASAQADDEVAGGDPWAGVEQMIVTGSGELSAILVESSKSVAAFDDSYLQAIGAQNVGDLAAFTPSLEITSAFAASNPEVFIRGVGLRDANSTASGAVAIIQDGVYLNSPAGQLSSLYDVSSVSVLRGPEGSKYGRNASAGAILIESNLPSGDFGGSLRLDYGRFNELGVQGFIEAPIIPDLLSWRAAFKVSQRDGTGKNRCGTSLWDLDDVIDNDYRTGFKCFEGRQIIRRLTGSDPRRPSAETNDRNNWAAKTFVSWTPTEELDVLFNAHGFRNSSLSRSFQAVANFENRATQGPREGLFARPVPGAGAGVFYFDQDNCIARDPLTGGCLRNSRDPERGDPYTGDYDFVGDENLDLWGANVKATWSRDAWTVKSVTAYEFNDRDAETDFDGTPFQTAQAQFSDSAWQISEDLRLTYDDEQSGFSVTLGAYYLYENLTSDNLLQQSPTAGFRQQIEQDTHYLGVFGFGELELNETITLEGGVRLNYERKDFDIDVNGLLFQPGSTVITGGVLSEGKGRDVVPSGEIVLRYDPTETVGFYSKLTRGYKGRIFNGGIIIAGDPNAAIKPAEPEFVNSLETGWKLKFFEDALMWNGAAFLYDYEDQQVFRLESVDGLATPQTVISNADDSRIAGVESDFTFRYEGFTVFGSFAYLFSEYGRFRVINQSEQFVPDGPPIVSLTRSDFSGRKLVNAPELSGSGFAQYKFEMGRLGELTPRLDFNYKSEIFFTPRNRERQGDDARWVLNLRLGYKDPNGRIEIAGWVKNLTDEIFRVTSFVVSGHVVYVMSDPRTYGGTVTVRF